ERYSPPLAGNSTVVRNSKSPMSAKPHQRGRILSKPRCAPSLQTAEEQPGRGRPFWRGESCNPSGRPKASRENTNDRLGRPEEDGPPQQAAWHVGCRKI